MVPLHRAAARWRFLRYAGIGIPLLFATTPAMALNYEVYPGSAFYMEQMLDRSLWPFVATHANGLYHHPVGFHELSDVQEELYTSHFTNRFAMVEGDMGSGSTTGDVANLQRMWALGLTPVAAFVNRPSTNLAVWRQLVRNNAAQGAPSYEMLAPHRLVESPLGWNDPIREYARDNMRVAGCIGSGVDAPVYLYVHRGPAYRQTIYDMRDWSVANDRKFNYLVSPNESYNEALLADTMFTVRDLEDQGQEPDVYGVVLYGLRPVDLTPEKVTVNGEDRAATTITGLAYYLIKHRDGEPGTIDLSATRNSITHAAGISSPVLSNPAQSIPLPAGPSTWQLGIANTSGWLDYAGVLRARTAGPGAADWAVTFQADGSDATAEILSARGRKFLRHERWMPGSTRSVTMTATPLVPAPGAFQLVVEALPHGMIDHALDTIAFTHGGVANTAPTIAFEVRPRITRENLPLGPVWFTCGDAETSSTALTVTASSSNTTLVPAANLQLGRNGIQRWLRVVPAAGKWGETTVTLTASDGLATTTASFTLTVERTTVLPVVKANNSIGLVTPASWTANATPGETDQAVWDATVTGPNITQVTTPLAVAGLRVTNPGGNVTIHAAAPLSLGVAGIDLGSASRDLFLTGFVETNEFSTWNIATGRTVRLEHGLGGLGGITKSGGGRLEILGPHPFAGPLTVNAGELVTTAAGSQSATTVSGNGLLRIVDPAGFGIGGLTISTANSSTGRVEISGGIQVLAGRSVTINSRSSNTDAIVSQGDNTFAGNISLSTGGSLHAVSSASGTLHLTGNVTSIATGSRSLTLRGAADGRATGTISNGSGTVGIIKSGNGRWTLAGTHNFTGPVSVQQGTLVVDQPLPQQTLTVAAGATLEGSATLGGAVTIAGAYSPGDGSGTQQITGGLAFLTGSTIRCDILSDTGADRIDAATVTFDPGVEISIVADHPDSVVDFSAPSWNQPREWTILNAADLTGGPAPGSVSRDSGGRPAAPFGTFSIATSTTGVILHWMPSRPWPRWQYASFGEAWDDPLLAAPGADPDGDGHDNSSEWIFGTTPTDANSRFQPEWTGGGLVVHRNQGRSYRVETSSTLEGPWTVHTQVPSGTGPIPIPCPQGAERIRFFRIAATMDD
jgi:autotransporter-associated beta strand protein